MGVGASVVNVNVGGGERARSEGGLFSRIVVGNPHEKSRRTGRSLSNDSDALDHKSQL